MPNAANQNDDAPLSSEELQDRYLRSLAELDNLRKRTVRDIEVARDQAESRVAAMFLPLLDDFKRVLSALADPNADQHPEAHTEAVQMLFNKTISTFTQLQIEGFESQGKQFARELMEAVAEVHTKDLPPGTVAAELSQGFTRRGKLLRAAQVAVAVPEDEE